MNSYKIEYQAIGGSNLLAKITDYIANHKIVMIILLLLFLYFLRTNTIEKFKSNPCSNLNEKDCIAASQCEWMDFKNKCFMREEEDV